MTVGVFSGVPHREGKPYPQSDSSIVMGTITSPPRMRCFAIAFAIAASCAASQRANAALPQAPSAVGTSMSGSLRVTEYGTAGKPALVFIPGLASGPWVWNAEITRLAPSYHIYALALPGFDGVKPLARTPYFDQVMADFWTFIAEKRVTRPIVVGHSLGGTLAIRLAEQNPGRLRGVVAVDGLPAFPGFANMPAAQRQTVAERIRSSLAGATSEQFLAAEQHQVLPAMITSEATVTEVAPLTAKSDPVAVAQWFYEDVLADARPDLAKATVPILEIAPYDAKVDAAPPVSLASLDAKQQYYRGLLQGAPDVQVVVIPNSRHFIMYDQPGALSQQLDDFFARVQKST